MMMLPSVLFYLFLLFTLTNGYSNRFMKRSVVTQSFFSERVSLKQSVQNKLFCSKKQEKNNFLADADVHSSSFHFWFNSLLEKITLFFPVWVLSFSLLGFKLPNLFLWFSPLITPALALTMASMGMTLSYSDFSKLLPNWRFILLGFLAQYSVMPLSAYYISKFMGLSPDLATGLILVGCAPGGTASNLVSYD